MPILVRWLALLICLALPALAQDGGSVLKLPTFTVVADLFSLDARFNAKGQVDLATITEVARNNPLHKLGVRVGARLISVNGTEIVGLKEAEFRELLREPAAGETKTLVFVQGKRVRKTITTHFTGKPAKR